MKNWIKALLCLGLLFFLIGGNLKEINAQTVQRMKLLYWIPKPEDDYYMRTAAEDNLPKIHQRFWSDLVELKRLKDDKSTQHFLNRIKSPSKHLAVLIFPEGRPLSQLNPLDGRLLEEGNYGQFFSQLQSMILEVALERFDQLLGEIESGSTSDTSKATDWLRRIEKIYNPVRERRALEKVIKTIEKLPKTITITPSKSITVRLWESQPPIPFEALGWNRNGQQIDKKNLHVILIVTNGIGSIDENGLFTAMNPGKGEIRAISQTDPKIQKPVEVTVIGIDRIQMKPEFLLMNPGDIKKISATVYDTQNQIIPDVTPEMKVIGEVVELRGQQLKAVKPGSGSVIASFGGKIGKAAIWVREPEREISTIHIKIEPKSLTFWVGGPHQEIEVKVFENDKLLPDSPEPEAAGDFLKIERIDQRKFRVTPQKSGRTIIVARYKGAIGTASVTIKVFVKPKEPFFLLPVSLSAPIFGGVGLAVAPTIRSDANIEKEKAKSILPTSPDDARAWASRRTHWGNYQRLQTREDMINFTSLFCSWIHSLFW